jgi:hypothetical protein
LLWDQGLHRGAQPLDPAADLLAQGHQRQVVAGDLVAQKSAGEVEVGTPVRGQAVLQPAQWKLGGQCAGEHRGAVAPAYREHDGGHTGGGELAPHRGLGQGIAVDHHQVQLVEGRAPGLAARLLQAQDTIAGAGGSRSPRRGG